MTRSTAGRHRTARLAAVAGGLAAIVAAGALAGCGAGQVAATSIVTSAVPGGSATVVPDPNNPTSAVYFSNVFIEPNGKLKYGVGSNAPLSVNIANQTTGTISITPGAVYLINSTTGEVGPQIGTVSWGGGATPATTPAAPPSSPSGSPSSAAPTPSQPSAPPAPDVHAVKLDPAGAVWLRPQTESPDAPYLQIENLTQELTPGQTVEIQFTVASGSGPVGGPVKVVAPIGPSDQTASRVPVAPSPTG